MHCPANNVLLVMVSCTLAAPCMFWGINSAGQGMIPGALQQICRELQHAALEAWLLEQHNSQSCVPGLCRRYFALVCLLHRMCKI